MKFSRVVALAVLGLLIGTGLIYWRISQVDEALQPTPANMKSLIDQANQAQSEADRLPEYSLPEKLSSALSQPGDFWVYHKVADVPYSVRSAFAKAAREESFLMADPNGPWNPTDVIHDPQLPRRRLVSAAVRRDLYLLFYEHGGIGRNATVAVFEVHENNARPIWHAYFSQEVTNPTALAQSLKDKKYEEEPFF